MEVVPGKVDCGHFLVADLDAFGIGVRIEFAMHVQAGGGGRGGNQLDDDAIADQRSGAPVLADEGEQAVLDLVPFAGPGWEVGDLDGEPGLVGQALQLALPQRLS